jgi:hypothetical protein
VYESHKTMEYTDINWMDHWDDDDGHRRLHPKPKPKPKPMHKWWSQVQKLYPSDPHEYRFFGDEVSVWGDVISIMGGGDALDDADDWSDSVGTPYYQVGSLYMFARSRTNPDTWTQQQKLYNPDLNDGTYFSHSVDDDYQGHYLDDAAAIKHNRFGLPRLHGTTMQVTSSSQHGYILTDNVDWKCLLITVGDGMGDGWDKARLVATAPTDPRTREVKHDTFSQYCDAYNYKKNDISHPLSRKLQETYRYCPLSPEDGGDYVFEVMANPRGKKGNKGKPSDILYGREIYWDIYNEFDKKRYIGDAHTKLTFNWGTEDFFFTMKKAERLYESPATCQQCNVWEGLQKKGQHQPKPKPQPQGGEEHRRLNLYPTPSPTSSISPTLVWQDNSYSDQWTFFMGRNASATVHGSTTAWNDKKSNGTGTHFYIYDSNGQNITEPLIWGTLCSLTGTIKDSCTTQDLPHGGTYTLRVTGGMDYRRDEIKWEFCNRVGTAMQSLVFTKYSSTCLPIAQYSSEDLCERSGFYVHTVFGVVLNGLIGLYSESRDSVIVESALKTMLHPYVVADVKIVIEGESLLGSESTENVVLRAEVTFKSVANNVDVQELDGLHNFETDLIDKLGYYDDNNLMASMLSSAAHDLLGDTTHTVMSGASFESHISSVRIVSAEAEKMKVYRGDHVINTAAEEGTEGQGTTGNEQHMDHAAKMEYAILNAEAIAGYVVMAGLAVAVVLVSWRRNVKKARRSGAQARGEAGLAAPLESGDHLVL